MADRRVFPACAAVFLVFLVFRFVRRYRNGIAARQPTAEINVLAASGAKRPVPLPLFALRQRFFADRATPRACHAQVTRFRPKNSRAWYRSCSRSQVA